MEVLQTVSLFFSVLVCFLLIFLILIQAGKGGSVGIFGSAGSNTAFGASTMDVITKLTWQLGAAFFAFSILAAVAFADSGPSAVPSPQLESPEAVPEAPETEQQKETKTKESGAKTDSQLKSQK